MSPPPTNAGTLIGQRLGKYELVALVARGGTAEIYLARIGGVAGFEKYVVVKCLHDHLADDSEFVRMFLDEARLTAQLDHSNIVQTLELGEEQGRYYIVMEYLAGMSLSLVARRVGERVPGGRLPVELTLGIAAQACGGLHYAHQKTSSTGAPLNIVHRDVSPQNLVISFEGIVKLVDFGIAKAEMRATHTRSGTIKGKFAYMSPEQCLAGDMDHRTDVFALGIIVHELLTGRRLFKRQSTYDTYHAIVEGKVPLPSSVNHELDPALDEVVMRALAYHREERYPSAEAFGEAMTAILHKRGKPVSAGTVAAYFERYFAKEINEHAERMRALVAGRQTFMDEQWDEPDASGEPDSERSMAAARASRPMRPRTNEPKTLDSPQTLDNPPTLDVPTLSPGDSLGAFSAVDTVDMDSAFTAADEGATRVDFDPMDASSAHDAHDAQDTHDASPPPVMPASRPSSTPPANRGPAPQRSRVALGIAPTMAYPAQQPLDSEQVDTFMPSPVEVVNAPARSSRPLTPPPGSLRAETVSQRPSGLISKAALPLPGPETEDEPPSARRSTLVPLPPIVGTPPEDSARRRRLTGAEEDFSMATMKTEPAGPRGVMNARAALSAQFEAESKTAPGPDLPGGAQDFEPSPGSVPQSAMPFEASGRYEDSVPGMRRELQHLTELSDEVSRGMGWLETSRAPRVDLVPLWLQVAIFVVAVAIGLGATLLLARLF